jgi:hypothetical protein
VPDPVASFPRRVILNGSVATDATPPGGGIEFTGTTFEIRNILQVGNARGAV